MYGVDTFSARHHPIGRTIKVDKVSTGSQQKEHAMARIIEFYIPDNYRPKRQSGTHNPRQSDPIPRAADPTIRLTGFHALPFGSIRPSMTRTTSGRCSLAVPSML